jgi:hypothetical protein
LLADGKGITQLRRHNTFYIDDTDRSEVRVTFMKNSGNNTEWGESTYSVNLIRSTLRQYWRSVLLKAAVFFGNFQI